MIVGLTGGIGSGKTTIAGMFKNLGIPIYIADERAKSLMVNSKELKAQIQELLGEEAYNNKDLNRAHIAEKVFKNKNLLNDLNAIVHPAVRDDFKTWYKMQDAPYFLKMALTKSVII
jgi:dephospho-CoA kinase